ncbi:hypothetical protein B0I75DRAFT_138001 [Yarrowia lipolytica]|jgi:uncharacterized protein YbjT (DUF2867 family)|uniref:YALI0A04323p n=2 Tax=Yarrowia lipolytica TaxID=4952 RepID=Q6CHW1_YARLI|nr:YALI0A04323p [Yarrowia lipolytica CLIB122]AOW00244.1 hypothetical protein YALI1_A04533g [Yarrowia lipolytica]KAB8284194.1 hypothetical protein BKA91DRAFT_135451 [Yarrowia lipolytica]KAE8173107.1 hypothetical protein BKA90DRAFT_136249 [Yarrowia lipolytica]KAJ8051361.1 hypothetical protein LXG23DRAFT_52504 [Yarrowia lipolytica]RDW23518.1 hypothetical protein B0I71DRAFT_135819 [Yarrowia lipolytica]|eukprot:XP_499750.1 YALI0A04323p [Yarrowia lipolytica CLIB122]
MTTVALVGANGVLGTPLINALSAAPGYKYPIIVVTRDASKSKNTDKVKYVQGSADEKGSLEAIFKGVDVVLNISSVKANWTGILDAVKAAGVKVYVPSEFGVDYTQFPDFHFLDLKKNHLEAARAVKGLKVVAVQNGVFGEFAVKYPSFLRLDPKTNKANPINPDAKWSATFLDDIAAALAVVLSKPVNEIPDVLELSGSEVTFREYYEIYGKKKGVKVEIVPAESIAEARATVKKNEETHNYDDAAFGLYLHLLQAENKGQVNGSGNKYLKKFKTLEDAVF